MLEYWSIYQLMMNELPVAVYWIGQDEDIMHKYGANMKMSGRAAEIL